MATKTKTFGVGKRESHDASAFYDRFPAPEISDDESIPKEGRDLDPGCIHGDATNMSEITDNSVALVVTSPPYFAGKAYEEILGENGVPDSYLQYLQLLHDVFAECKKKLEPGGRIAINVANLGRKPYRSLSADVIDILQNDLKLLIRGEVIWRKAEGAGGNCAWGSFSSASNPVLRDVTERVIIASKGRFDRAKTIAQRAEENLPCENTLTNDEFMQATLDVWDIAPESARRVNHPAPFPVELPERLIHLYTYKNDLVLDPFVGSGTTLVAAIRTGRRSAGYDLDESYVEIAQKRVAEEQALLAPAEQANLQLELKQIATPATDISDGFQAKATREGKAALAIAESVLEDAGFQIVQKNARLRGLGVSVNFVAEDKKKGLWYFDVSGAFTTTRGGLVRTDVVWKSLGRAHVIMSTDQHRRLILLTSHLPKRGSDGDVAMRAVGAKRIFDAMEMLSDQDRERLSIYATEGRERPLSGYWTPAQASER